MMHLKTSLVAVFLAFATPALSCDDEAQHSDSDKTPIALLKGTFGKSLTASTDGKIVEGVVTDVCKEKGCWMKVKTSDNKITKVSFEDYGFFVPTSIVGQKIRMRARDTEKGGFVASGVEIVQQSTETGVAR
jgi:hypothetical protein